MIFEETIRRCCKQLQCLTSKPQIKVNLIMLHRQVTFSLDQLHIEQFRNVVKFADATDSTCKKKASFLSMHIQLRMASRKENANLHALVFSLLLTIRVIAAVVVAPHSTKKTHHITNVKAAGNP